MKKITKKILYREHSPYNKITDKVDQNIWFEVETQMNRGPDSKDVDKNLVENVVSNGHDFFYIPWKSRKIESFLNLTFLVNPIDS